MIEPSARRRPLSLWRSHALRLWPPPYSAMISATIEVEVGAALAYLAAVNPHQSTRLTLTHLFVKGFGVQLARDPTLNAVVHGRRIYEASRVDVGMFCLVNGGADVSFFRVTDVDRKDLAALADAIRAGAKAAEVEYAERAGRGRAVPLALVRLARRLRRLAGRESRGGLTELTMAPLVVSSMGMYPVRFTGVTAAIPRFAGVSTVVCLGQVMKKPVVVGEEVVVRPIVPVSLTSDHRLIDGVGLGRYAYFIEEFMRDPRSYLEERPGAADGSPVRAAETTNGGRNDPAARDGTRTAGDASATGGNHPPLRAARPNG